MPTRSFLSALGTACLLGAGLLGSQLTHVQTINAATSPHYVYTLVASPHDPTFTQLLGINDHQLIAGYDGSGMTVNGVLHPFNGFTLTLPHSFASENVPGSMQTQVVAIDTKGDTAGFSIDAANTTHGFLDINGHVSTTDLPGTTFNQLLGLNNRGQATGYFQDAKGLNHAYVREPTGAFLVLPGDALPNSQATGIDDAGTVVGFTQPTSTTSDGFIMRGDAIARISYPGSPFTQALGENNQGQIVGTYNDTAGTAHGFLYQHGTFRTLDVPGATSTVINGINDQGRVVGFITDAANNTVGIVGTPTADDVQRFAQLQGKHEVPGPGDANGGGTALLTLDAGRNQVCYSIAVAGLSGRVTKAHIHQGAAGKTGQVAVEFTAPTQGSSSGCASITHALLVNLLQHPSSYYVNVHTSAFPNGAARGQLSS